MRRYYISGSVRLEPLLSWRCDVEDGHGVNASLHRGLKVGNQVEIVGRYPIRDGKAGLGVLLGALRADSSS
jgi:hypothetical protein